MICFDTDGGGFTAFLLSWWYICKLFQVAFFTDPCGKKNTQLSMALVEQSSHEWDRGILKTMEQWSKHVKTNIWSLPQNSGSPEDHWVNSQLCIWRVFWCILLSSMVLYCYLRYSTHCFGSSPFEFSPILRQILRQILKVPHKVYVTCPFDSSHISPWHCVVPPTSLC